MRRVLVIGPSGAGKSTFARRLAEHSGLPVVHLDELFWRPGWVLAPVDEWNASVAEVLAGEAWIMDGNYSRNFAVRMAACDTVIFLERSGLACAWRLVKRSLRFRGTTRPSMPASCPERFSLKLIALVLTYRWRSQPKVERQLAERGEGVRLVRLRSDREADEFLAATV